MVPTVTDDGARAGRRRRGPTGRASSAPSARRQTSARLADARLWLGIALVVASMLVGAKVMTTGDDTVTIWRAGRDLSVGSTPSGLEPVAVSRSAVQDTYVSGVIPSGVVLGRPLAAGEFLPVAALAQKDREAVRQVTVAVDPLHAPTGLEPGDLVDVWSTPQADSVVGRPALVLAAVSVSGTTEGIGVGGEIGVVLDVPQAQVAEVVAATRSGAIDLVAVPVGSQEAQT